MNINSKYEYVIITPARNEENFIEKTIISVIKQTILPQKWLIVDDNSIDRTSEIIKKYEKHYSFIQYMRNSKNDNRNFGSKIYAFNEGYKYLKNVKYSFIGNLDADISFDEDYFYLIIHKFLDNPKLGIAGGIVLESINGRFVKQINYENSVAGAVQLFRRRCYLDIGGYQPLKYGGVDAVAEIKARKSGWEVKTFSDIFVYHNGRVGGKLTNILKTRFRQGRKDYLIGYHPLFYLFSCLYRFHDKPVIIGSLLKLTGYFLFFLKKQKKSVSNDLIEYFTQEQIWRLKKKLTNLKYLSHM